MTPPETTPIKRADEFEIAAKIARELGDFEFAVECQLHAFHLRDKEATECGKTQNS